MPTRQDFQTELDNILQTARSQGLTSVDVDSGDLHRRVGGYPGNNHRMPVCCDVMKSNMNANDVILSEPPIGQGIITIRYHL